MKQGNILYIDLGKHSYRIDNESYLFDEFLGGTAVATELLFRYGKPELDAYHEESPIIFAIGPFNGMYPVATKTVSLFKSPLSRELGESHAGGRMAMAMREANIDAIVITGKSPEPVYVVIKDDSVKFCSAKTIWGQSCYATERILKEAEGLAGRKLSILRAGNAGERLSPIACATVDGSRHFGRMGLGGVMGSKNLKAVVISGTKGVKIDDAKAYNEVYNELHDRIVNSKEMKKYHDLGTASNVLPLSKIRGLPTRNFSQGSFESSQAISGEEFARTHLVQHTACGHCPCGCIHLAILRDEFKPYHYINAKVSYDYELIYSLGSILSLSSPQDILRLIYFIEKQGWDAISIGVTLGWAADAYIRGIITNKDTGGIAITFGDANAFYEALQRCANGENEFYSLLEKGSAACSEKYGGKEFSIQYGRVEPGGYLTGENFIVTSLLGVRHSHLDDFGYSLDQKIMSHDQPIEDQVKAQVKDAQWRMILNSLVICLFGRGVYEESIIVKGLNVLGLGWDIEKLGKLAVRTLQRKHEWKKLCGFSTDSLEERVPERMYKVHSVSGVPDKKNIKERIKYYCKIAGI
jgi:aldehyde:ferredoxin oxidoreductase